MHRIQEHDGDVFIRGIAASRQQWQHPCLPMVAAGRFRYGVLAIAINTLAQGNFVAGHLTSSSDVFRKLGATSNTTLSPSPSPSSLPTVVPQPTPLPSATPSTLPSSSPTLMRNITFEPSSEPSRMPVLKPTSSPTFSPTPEDEVAVMASLQMQASVTPTAATVFPAVAAALNVDMTYLSAFTWTADSRRLLSPRKQINQLEANARRLTASGSASFLVRQSLSASGQSSSSALQESYTSQLNAALDDGSLVTQLKSSCNCDVAVASVTTIVVERNPVPTPQPSSPAPGNNSQGASVSFILIISFSTLGLALVVAGAIFAIRRKHCNSEDAYNKRIFDTGRFSSSAGFPTLLKDFNKSNKTSNFKKFQKEHHEEFNLLGEDYPDSFSGGNILRMHNAF